jgi:hypothetical protein
MAIENAFLMVESLPKLSRNKTNSRKAVSKFHARTDQRPVNQQVRAQITKSASVQIQGYVRSSDSAEMQPQVGIDRRIATNGLGIRNQ